MRVPAERASQHAAELPHAADGLVVAAPLPDVFVTRRRRGGLIGVVSRNGAVVGGLAVIGAMAFVALLAPVLTSHDPAQISPMTRLRPPSLTHPFGTDMLGRDLYTRVLYGARVSLIVGFSVAFLASAIGLMIGLFAGYFRALDGLIMRTMDGFMAIPGILLAIALMALWGGSVTNVIIAITLVEIPRVARLIRGVVLSLREQTFVEAAVAAGTPAASIVLRHILPNTLAPLMVQATYVCGAAMLVESILSFIGAGVPPSIPTWGNIMADGRALWQLKPELVFIPAIALSVTILAVNLVGDGLRDRFDPRMARNV